MDIKVMALYIKSARIKIKPGSGRRSRAKTNRGCSQRDEEIVSSVHHRDQERAQGRQAAKAERERERTV